MEYVENPSDGTTIAYETIGAGTPLVLLHGSALSHSIWRGFGYVKALRDQYRLILIDMRGHGRSGKPHDVDAYAMDLVTEDVLAVLDELRVETAMVLGYSFGGRIALSLAERAPDRVGGLVVGGGSSRPQEGSFDRLFFPGCVDVLAEQGIDAFLEQWGAVRAWPIDPGTRAAFRANDPVALAAYMRRCDVEPGISADSLRQFRVPTLAFVGSDDSDRLADTEELAALIPGARAVVIDGFDHSTTVAATDEVLRVVEPFLDFARQFA
ncbi:alpha/beta fold hydrolase [Rhodococcus sp. NPDC058521]|uniref:alpha/beta fold hydrolase n=1 Tax=Rhodococcus sp. NPDC058521 TaxID=3346536 RepID=UPI003657F613